MPCNEFDTTNDQQYVEVINEVQNGVAKTTVEYVD